MRNGWWLAAVGLTQVSCDDHILGEGGPAVSLSCLRDPPLTYENFGDAILDRHCNSCHSIYSRVGQRGDAPLDVNFDTWEDVVAWADRIQARGVDDKNMPPAGGMVDQERVLLGEWLRCEVFPSLGEFEAGTTSATTGESQ